MFNKYLIGDMWCSYAFALIKQKTQGIQGILTRLGYLLYIRQHIWIWVARKNESFFLKEHTNVEEDIYVQNNHANQTKMNIRIRQIYKRREINSNYEKGYSIQNWKDSFPN